MRYFVFIFILFTIYSFIPQDNKYAIEKRCPNYPIGNYPNTLKDTCLLAGLTFKIIDYKSGRNLHATIKNGEIEIKSEGVQFFKYRVIYYVFSSVDNSKIPVVRIFDGKIAYRILEVLKHARVGGQYIFEDIIVVDPSGIKLDNEVRSILIERIK